MLVAYLLLFKQGKIFFQHPVDHTQIINIQMKITHSNPQVDIHWICLLFGKRE